MTSLPTPPNNNSSEDPDPPDQTSNPSSYRSTKDFLEKKAQIEIEYHDPNKSTGQTENLMSPLTQQDKIIGLLSLAYIYITFFPFLFYFLVKFLPSFFVIFLKIWSFFAVTKCDLKSKYQNIKILREMHIYEGSIVYFRPNIYWISFILRIQNLCHDFLKEKLIY